jgi:hypothetical protein
VAVVMEPGRSASRGGGVVAAPAIARVKAPRSIQAGCWAPGAAFSCVRRSTPPGEEFARRDRVRFSCCGRYFREQACAHVREGTRGNGARENARNETTRSDNIHEIALRSRCHANCTNPGCRK